MIRIARVFLIYVGSILFGMAFALQVQTPWDIETPRTLAFYATIAILIGIFVWMIERTDE